MRVAKEIDALLEDLRKGWDESFHPRHATGHFAGGVDEAARRENALKEKRGEFDTALAAHGYERVGDPTITHGGTVVSDTYLDAPMKNRVEVTHYHDGSESDWSHGWEGKRIGGGLGTKQLAGHLGFHHYQHGHLGRSSFR